MQCVSMRYNTEEFRYPVHAGSRVRMINTTHANQSIYAQLYPDPIRFDCPSVNSTSNVLFFPVSIVGRFVLELALSMKCEEVNIVWLSFMPSSWVGTSPSPCATKRTLHLNRGAKFRHGNFKACAFSGCKFTSKSTQSFEYADAMSNMSHPM